MIKKEAVIVGAGPAGLGAAIELAKRGVQVLLIDENHRAGGQLFKQIHKFFGSQEHNAGVRGFRIAEKLMEQVQGLGVELWLDSAVVGVFPNKELLVRRNHPDGADTVSICAQKLLLATGGAENSIRFPGWTLPGVMGAGAAQTMVNVNRVLPGKRILMVGSGNVGLIVSYQLMQAGADVVGIVEAADHIGGYGVHAAKVKRLGVDYYLGYSILRAEGENDRVCRATIAKLDGKGGFLAQTEKTFSIDTLCLAVGLRPLTDLIYPAGIQQAFVRNLGGWMPIHDEHMMTLSEGIYVAGDVTGVEEANTALDEGRLAGLAITETLGKGSHEEVKSEMQLVSERLKTLRQGPFGIKREEAKERIIQAAHSTPNQQILDSELGERSLLFRKGMV